MHNILKPNNFTDDSPFQYARMTRLKQLIDENYQKYVSHRREFTGRLDSNHLLMNILQNMPVPKGSLESGLAESEVAARRIASTLGMTTSSARGRVFMGGVFYEHCPEIIIYNRGPEGASELWADWRNVSPIKVLCHPVSDTTIFELAVKNGVSITMNDLVVIQVDIPLLMGQYRMWRSGNPDKTMENFLTEVPLVNMMKSHLNVAMFNKVQVQLGIRQESNIRTNLPFAQIPTNLPAEEVAKEVVEKITAKEMKANQILASIPCFYGDHYLNQVNLYGAAPNFQILWAIIAQKMEAAAVTLEVGSKAGFNRMLQEITEIKRFLIVDQQDKVLVNGLTTAAGIMLRERFDSLVTQRLPA